MLYNLLLALLIINRWHNSEDVKQYLDNYCRYIQYFNIIHIRLCKQLYKSFIDFIENRYDLKQGN